jgi:hypothetical protein
MRNKRLTASPYRLMPNFAVRCSYKPPEFNALPKSVAECYFG